MWAKLDKKEMQRQPGSLGEKLMQVWVNEKPVVLENGNSVYALLEQLNLPLAASAIALNDAIIARSQWEITDLNDGDRIALFQAIAGG
ncbi:sulfur carrier protein ThiS [Vibrio sp. Of7-15]|uniref:sulfur carrier protein ThiS n=1 Tax=Vibrio sp. Of7-15 TaxID=2724879 RepID=UPI001EF2BC50|nr:sulfur carrier protein ThiS [Vibrio sp. Of7-15]MCG7496701.1 sulfur carrier protein ThiS [Vibrio sp. Of7-15]